VDSSLFFLTGTRLTAEALETSLVTIARRLVRVPAGVRVGPQTRVSTSPWSLWPVSVEPEAREGLTAALVDASAALAVRTDHEVLGLSLGGEEDEARVCRCAPGQEPQVVTGSRERIAVTLAKWLEIDPERMAVVLGLTEEGAEVPGPDAGQLEEEAYITRKLAEARVWMERYKAGGNKDS
jgi:hypothetical protein